MEKGTDLGARNGIRIKKTRSAWLLQAFELPDQRECYLQHRHFLFQKKKKNYMLFSFKDRTCVFTTILADGSKRSCN